MVTNNNKIDYRGLSTDEKPVLSDSYEDQNSLFLEVDTGDFYGWTGAAWVKVGE
jgi:hypothetical protein